MSKYMHFMDTTGKELRIPSIMDISSSLCYENQFLYSIYTRLQVRHSIMYLDFMLSLSFLQCCCISIFICLRLGFDWFFILGFRIGFF